MYKIAVLGDRESIMGFASLGLAVFEVTNRESAVQTVHNLEKNEYAVIYITEELAGMIPEVLEEYRNSAVPALILIPGVSGNTGEGARGVHRCVEQAVGSDILSNE